MGRKPKPWFRKQNKTWYVCIAGKQTKLGQDKEAAHKLFHKLMAQEVKTSTAAGASVAMVLDRFLGWVKDNRAARTFDWYADHLQAFADAMDNPLMAAEDIRPHHVEAWVSGKPWSASYRRGAMGAVQRAFKWAAGQGVIENSPLILLSKPTAERREEFPTKEEYELMLANSTEPFSSLLRFVWLTGARPQEATAIEPRHIDGQKVKFPVKESKGKKRARVIYLCREASEILAQHGGRFTNMRGNAWTAYAVNCRMRRISEKTKKHYCLYSLRHAYATRMLEAGMDHVTLAKLMGHKDATMIAKNYSHVGEKSDFLEEVVKRFNE